MLGRSQPPELAARLAVGRRRDCEEAIRYMAKGLGTKPEILEAIRRHHRSGKPLNYSGVRNTNARLLIKAREKFGTWRKAVEAAGFDYDKVSLIHRWSEKEIISQLRELHRKRAFPDISTLSRNHHKLYEACCRRFGSGLAALEAAGIDYEELLDEHPYRWTRGQIIREMKRRYNEGRTLRRSEILRREPKLKRFCYATMHQFGNWTKALRAAGLNPDALRNRDGLWPKAKVLEGIRRRFAQGKLLNTDCMLREDLPLHAAGRRHFGTWKAAVEKAGIDYRLIRGGLFGWTKAKTRIALRDRLSKRGASQKAIREQSPSLFRAAIHHFGSWEQAVREARRNK